MPINKSNIKPFACRVTRINGTRNKITSNLARKGFKHSGRVLPLVFPPAASSRRERLRAPREPFHERHPSGILTLSTIALSVLAFVGIGISFSSNVDASENVLFTVNASAPSVEISVPSAVGFDITPSSDGVFGYTSFNVTAGSNNSDGYTLTMYTTDLTNPTDLKGNDTGTLIQTLTAKANSAGYTRNDFTMNRWGYKYCFNGSNGTTTGNHITKLCSAAEDLYYPVIDKDISGNTLTATTGPHNAETTTVTLATKLDNNIPADSYSTILTFIVTANASTDTSSFDRAFYANGKTTYANTGLYAMQDMNSTICSQVKNDKEAKLIDKRDNKVYWVAKLKNSRTPANEYDGKCWMTQDLDLNLSTTTALTDTDTDLHSVSSWTPINSTIDSSAKAITVQTTSSNTSSDDFAPGWSRTTGSDIPFSADSGDRYTLPTYADQIYTSWWSSHDVYYQDGSALINCNNALTTDNAYDFVGTNDCTHFSIGNHYNFAAATATNSVSGTVGHAITNDDNGKIMPDSICPVNWRLPNGVTTDTNNNTLNSEFDALLYAYSVTNLVGATAGQNIGYYTSDNINMGLNNVRKAPLYFIRPGDINNGTLYSAGVASHLWTSTISSTSNGYDLGFDSTGMYPARSRERYMGFSVRCLAR